MPKKKWSNKRLNKKLFKNNNNKEMEKMECNNLKAAKMEKILAFGAGYLLLADSKISKLS